MTGMPSANARAFTGGAWTSRPRPRGLSGWHTTPTTSATSVNASRLGTAKSGVPKKSARISFRSLLADFDRDRRRAHVALEALERADQRRQHLDRVLALGERR